VGHQVVPLSADLAPAAGALLAAGASPVTDARRRLDLSSSSD
jgi:hypothetical protein